MSSPGTDDAPRPVDPLAALVAANGARLDIEHERGVVQDGRLDRIERQIDALMLTPRNTPPPGKLDDLIPDGERIGKLGEGVAKWKGGVLWTGLGLVFLYLLATGELRAWIREWWDLTHPPVQVDVRVSDPRATDNSRRIDSLISAPSDTLTP